MEQIYIWNKVRLGRFIYSSLYKLNAYLYSSSIQLQKLFS